MKTNNSTMIAATLLVLSGVAMSAPVDRRDRSDVYTFRVPINFDPTINTGPRTKTVTTNNNGDGDGNRGNSKTTLNQHSNNGSQNQVSQTQNERGGSGKKDPSDKNQGSNGGKDESKNKPGDGPKKEVSGKSPEPKGSNEGSKDKQVGGAAKNEKEKNKPSSNATNGNKSTKTAHQRRKEIVNNNGDGDGNRGHSHVTVQKNDGNFSHNKDSHSKHDSHNNKVDTSFDMPIFRRATGTATHEPANENEQKFSRLSFNLPPMDRTQRPNCSGAPGTCDVPKYRKSQHGKKVPVPFGEEPISGRSISPQGKHGKSIEDLECLGLGVKSPNCRSHKTGGAKPGPRDDEPILPRGDGNNNHGHSHVTVENHDGNHSHNVDNHSHHDSHNNHVSTDLDIPFFRRSTQESGESEKKKQQYNGHSAAEGRPLCSGHVGVCPPYNNRKAPDGMMVRPFPEEELLRRGDGNNNHGHSHVTVENHDGNHSHNVDNHSHHDSHNNHVSTDLDIPFFRRSTQEEELFRRGDGNNNHGHSHVEVENHDGNHSHNVDNHSHHDSHNNKVDTSIGLPSFSDFF